MRTINLKKKSETACTHLPEINLKFTGFYKKACKAKISNKVQLIKIDRLNINNNNLNINLIK